MCRSARRSWRDADGPRPALVHPPPPQLCTHWPLLERHTLCSLWGLASLTLRLVQAGASTHFCGGRHLHAWTEHRLYPRTRGPFWPLVTVKKDTLRVCEGFCCARGLAFPGREPWRRRAALGPERLRKKQPGPWLPARRLCLAARPPSTRLTCPCGIKKPSGSTSPVRRSSSLQPSHRPCVLCPGSAPGLPTGRPLGQPPVPCVCVSSRKPAQQP